MRDPIRMSAEWRRSPDARARRSRARGRARSAGGARRDPAGWALAFDAAVPERRDGHERRGREAWSGRERRHEPQAAPEKEDGGGLMQRTRRLATKFREPLIGLGLAGASIPLLHHGQRRPEEAAPKEPAPSTAPVAAASPAAEQAAATNRDLDREVGAHWANAERSNIVSKAVDTYGISPQLAGDIYDSARNAGVDPKLAYGLVKTESGFDNRALSNVGARGLTQLMPATARWLKPGTSASDLYNPKTSLQLGFHYLRRLLDKYDGNRHLALLAYNRGPGTVDHALARGVNPDNGYAAHVMGDRLK